MTCELYTRRDPLCTNMSHDYNLRACPLTCRQASLHKFAHGALLFRPSCIVNPHLLFIYVCILHFLAVTPPSILFHEHTPRVLWVIIPTSSFQRKYKQLNWVGDTQLNRFVSSKFGRAKSHAAFSLRYDTFPFCAIRHTSHYCPH